MDNLTFSFPICNLYLVPLILAPTKTSNHTSKDNVRQWITLSCSMSSVSPNWFVPGSLFSVKICPFSSQFHLGFYHEGGCSAFSKAFSATIDTIVAVNFKSQFGIICNQLGGEGGSGGKTVSARF